jgi:hypothetical protein
MKARTWSVMACGVLSLACTGCMAHSANVDYARSKFQVMVSAETQQWSRGQPATERSVQSEVDRLLAMKPSAPVPSKLVLYEVPSSGHSEIKSPKKLIELRRAVSATVKATLEETKIFEEVDFLPDLLLPAGGTGDLKTLRIAAARAHADGVLIYSTEAGYEYEPNGFAVLYPTLIGIFLSPGSQAASTALSKAILLDVKTGYIYSVLETYGEAESGMVPFASLDPEELEFKARTQAMDALAKAAAEKVKIMKK